MRSSPAGRLLRLRNVQITPCFSLSCAMCSESSGPSPRQVNLNVTSMYSSGLFISEIKMDQPALALLTFIDTNASCSKQNRGAKQSVSKPCSNGLAFARHGGGARMGYAG